MAPFVNNLCAVAKMLPIFSKKCIGGMGSSKKL
jgi:hypothetical protein